MGNDASAGEGGGKGLDLEAGKFRFRVLEPGRVCVKIWNSGEFVFDPAECAELAAKFSQVAPRPVGSLDALREAVAIELYRWDRELREYAEMEWADAHPKRKQPFYAKADILLSLLERSSVSEANRPESLKWYCVNCQKMVPVTITHGDMVCSCGMVIASGAAGQGEGT